MMKPKMKRKRELSKHDKILYAVCMALFALVVFGFAVTYAQGPPVPFVQILVDSGSVVGPDTRVVLMADSVVGDSVWLTGTSAAGLWSTLGDADTIYVLGTADTIVKYFRDPTNDTTTMHIEGSLILDAGNSNITLLNDSTYFGDPADSDDVVQIFRFSTATGVAGIQLDDATQAMQYRNPGGSWTAIGSGGGSTDSTRVGTGLMVMNKAGDSIAAPADTVIIDSTAYSNWNKAKDSVGAWDNGAYPKLMDTSGTDDTLVYVATDTLFKVRYPASGKTELDADDDDSLIVGSHSSGVRVGADGLTSTDSLIVNEILYLQSEAGATDSSYYISRQDISDGEHCLYYVTVSGGPDSIYYGSCTGGSGTADSMGVDTDGNGTVDSYLYSTTAGAFHIKKSTGMTVSVAGDTVSLATTLGTTVDSTEIADSSLSMDDINWQGGLADSRVQNNITVDKASDVDTTGTDISTALAGRLLNNADDATTGELTADALVADSVTLDTIITNKIVVSGNIAVTGTVDTVDVGVLGSTVPKITDDTTNYQTAYTHSQDNSQAHSDYMLNTGDVVTGVYDLGGATSLEIPNSASPSTTVEGQLAWDSGDDMAEVYDGVQSVVVAQKAHHFTFTVLDPSNLATGTDTIVIMKTDASIYPDSIIFTELALESREATTDSVWIEAWTSLDHSTGTETPIDTLGKTTARGVTATAFNKRGAATNEYLVAIIKLANASVTSLVVRGTFWIKDN